MRIPIQFALSYPDRLKADFPRFDFARYPNLTFEQPDIETFRNLGLAYEALAKGGNSPCILNAANEIVVAAFLREDIGFLEMSDIIAEAMAKADFVNNPTLEDYINTDKMSRIITQELIKSKV
jgi:1-deoxy-D-xylulose-5-phosphate reductoisomerase